MGNFLGYYASNPNQEQQPEPAHLSQAIHNVCATNTSFAADGNFDLCTKAELINFIKSMKIKSINSYDERTKQIELVNTKIVPMSIELYTKLLEILGQYIRLPTDKPKRTSNRRFVKPMFGVDAIMQSLAEAVIEPHTIALYPYTNINTPSVPMYNMEITIDEFDEAFGNILTKKDMIGVSKRMLKDMPMYLKIRFVNAYNEIIACPENIQGSNIARGTYMYKVGKNGKTDDINSFRPILAVPNVVNHFHRILSMRLGDYMMSNNYIDDNIQKGGIPGQKYSIFEQVYKLKSIIKDANKYKKSCTIVYLDIKNAFGSIKLDRIYNILGLYHVDPQVVSYIRTFYQDLEYYFDIGNVKTDPIKWTGGLVQGCAMSPILFVIALNYIMTHIENKYKADYGYELSTKCVNKNNSVKILSMAYVDDIAYVCKDTKSANIVLGEFIRLCDLLGMRICQEKCAVMKINDGVDNGMDIDNGMDVDNSMGVDDNNQYDDNCEAETNQETEPDIVIDTDDFDSIINVDDIDIDNIDITKYIPTNIVDIVKDTVAETVNNIGSMMPNNNMLDEIALGITTITACGYNITISGADNCEVGADIATNVDAPTDTDITINVNTPTDTDAPTDTNYLSQIKSVTDVKYLGEYLSITGKPYESYKQFIKLLIRKMGSIHYKNCSFEDKYIMYKKMIEPWIQRKIMMLYDINVKAKLSILKIIRSYYAKWSIRQTPDLFCDVKSIIKKSTDNIIQQIPLTVIDNQKINYLMYKHLKFEYRQLAEDADDEINYKYLELDI